jgi:hypothetical protein
MSASDDHAARSPWHKSAESLVESIPGMISATIEGSRKWVSEVRVWYEPTAGRSSHASGG